MFSNAHNFEINNSTFHYSNNQDPVSTILCQHIASGAIFDSAERFPPGRCHPGTRTRVIGQINDWINDPLSKTSVLWLYGPAGSGKSALAHSIAELLRQVNPARYGGTFFFCRGPTDRGRSDKLFPTLAYQIALQVPAIRHAINHALAHDPTIPTKSIDHQLKSLIIDPLLGCKEWPSHPPTVFIDGLDECDDGEDGIETQCYILTLISEALINHRIPIRIFIASRPEYWIRDLFEIGTIKSLALSLSLRDDVDADKDIKMYLKEGFEEVRMKNIRVMRSVETPWPPENIVDRFVEDASGQYIYAATVLKFVGKSSRFCDPQEQLRVVTTPGSHRASAFSDLDKLYATILSAYPRRDSIMAVLGGLLGGAGPGAIRLCLGVSLTELTLVLDALSSLINISKPNSEVLEDVVHFLEPIFGSPLVEEGISFCHLSFRQFLEDPNRSGSFFIDVAIYSEKIAQKLLDIIANNFKGGYETEPHVTHELALSEFKWTMKYLLPRCFKNCSTEARVSLSSNFIDRIEKFLPIPNTIKHSACLERDMECLNQIGGRLSSIIGSWAAHNKISRNRHYKLTPTLAFIDLWQCGDNSTDYYGRFPASKLLAIPGQTLETTASCLQMHRQIINPEIFEYAGEWCSGVTILGMNLLVKSSSCTDSGWLSRAEWSNAYIQLLHQSLESLLRDSVENQNGITWMSGHIPNIIIWSPLIVGNSISEDAFRRSHKVAIFNLFMDPSGWMGLRSRMGDRVNDFEYLMWGILIWLHSELRIPEEREYIKAYDATLPQKMVEMMRSIFDNCFSPETLKFPPLICLDYDGPNCRWVEFLAPPNGAGEPLVVEKHLPRSPDSIYRYAFERRHHIYQALFGGTPLVNSFDKDPILYPASTIYPRLATFILQVIVGYQCNHYGLRSSFVYECVMEDDVETSYVFHCLSYAQPTQQNLDALRASRYLDINHKHTYDIEIKQEKRWLPPLGFCVSILNLLRKYERSDLSVEELKCFQDWLEGLKALEIPLAQFSEKYRKTTR